MSITIDDIAAKCGLSRSTVSRVLRSSPNVSEKSRQLVQKVIEESGYRPNQVAQSLAQGYSNTVALIIGNISSIAQIEIVKEIQRELYERHFMTWLCNSDYDPDLCAAYLDTALSSKLAGVVLITANPASQKLRQISSAGMPIVLINQQESTANCDSVLSNDQRAAYDAVNYLVRKGHRNIVLLSSYRARITSYNAYLGYCAALEENGIQFSDNKVYNTEIDEYSNALKMRRTFEANALFSKNSDVSAVVCTSNDVLTEFYWQCRKMGLSIPDSLSLVSLDPVQEATSPEIDFCSFGAPQHLLGKAATEQLFTRIQARNSSKSGLLQISNTNIVLDPVFTAGSSVRDLTSAHSSAR